MRFMSAQLLAYLEDGLWVANARAANANAERLAAALASVKGVELNDPGTGERAFSPPACRFPAPIEVRGHSLARLARRQGRSVPHRDVPIATEKPESARSRGFAGNSAVAKRTQPVAADDGARGFGNISTLGEEAGSLQLSEIVRISEKARAMRAAGEGRAQFRHRRARFSDAAACDRADLRRDEAGRDPLSAHAGAA